MARGVGQEVLEVFVFESEGVAGDAFVRFCQLGVEVEGEGGM